MNKMKQPFNSVHSVKRQKSGYAAFFFDFDFSSRALFA
jgi:hypothetical protein